MDDIWGFLPFLLKPDILAEPCIKFDIVLVL